jgi:hypothetical protein
MAMIMMMIMLMKIKMMYQLGIDASSLTHRIFFDIS